MQVSRNDITANEKDVAAARKDSRPPGKGFTGSGKITAVRENFYGTWRYVTVARKYVAAAGIYAAATGKLFTVAGKKVLRPPGKRFYGCRETILQPLGNDSRLPGKDVAATGKVVAATGKWFTAAGKKGLGHRENDIAAAGK